MNKIRLSKKQQYWLLQIVGWFSIVFVETINYTFFIVREFVWVHFIQFCLIALSGLIASHLYKIYFINISIFDKSLSKIWGKAFIDTFFITLIIVCTFFLPVIFTQPGYFSTTDFYIQFFGQMMNIARYVVVWIIIYYLYHILDRNRIISQQKLIVENIAKTSELELLKSQLNPHFLFNALNSIKALVLIDAEKAREAIIKLSELLRFTLNYEKTPLIRLSDEIDEVIKYLELEKIRFGDRLDVHIDLQEETLDAKVPPAMILTFAENAIKHGITQLPDGGVIEIKSTSNSHTIKVEVCNTGKLKENESKGIGLKNSTKRLQTLFGEKAELLLQSKSSDKVSVSITYPLKYNSHA
jgi:two-component system, LytTR family, sensor kinase